MLLQLWFLWLYGRHIAGLHAAGVGLWLGEYREWLGGGLMYVPTVVLSWAVGLHYSLSGRPERFILLASAAVFCAALICRSIDLVVCRQLPMGHHFLWHVLNGLVVYLAMRALVVAHADSPARVTSAPSSPRPGFLPP